MQAHTGITEGTFFRDQGWHFYMLGRLIERADQVTRLLDIKYHLLVPAPRRSGGVAELTQWNAVLRAAAGYHAFRRVAHAGFKPWDVVSFLLSDTSFARSVALCVRDIEWHLNQLRSRYGLRDTGPILERVGELRAALAAGSGFMQPGGTARVPRPVADRPQPGGGRDRHGVFPGLAAVVGWAASAIAVGLVQGPLAWASAGLVPTCRRAR